MHIHCPHCHNAIDIVEDTSFRDVACPTCGSHFSLVGSEDPTIDCSGAPRTLAHFELIEQLGAGHFGVVWKAKDTALDRFVAVKIPRKEQMDEEDVEKFFREARTAAQLQHGSIVAVHEVGRQDETLFIASDYVEGATLQEWLQQQPLPTREAVDLCIKIADALHVAHQAGVVHRDLKPHNIMMDMDGEPHIMDFGLAKRDSAEITMTVDGALLGTPAYMSPEQAAGKGHEADTRSDVYSLGVILFQMLTGELPFRGEKRMLLIQIQQDQPPSPRRLSTGVPRDLDTICLKCLEKDPDRRYLTTKAFAEDLRRFLDNRPIRARPVSRADKIVRWCKRHPAVSALSTALALVLISSLLVFTSLWIRANNQASKAIAEARRANTVVELLEELLGSANPESGAPADLTVRELLDTFSENITDVLQGQPKVEAILRGTIGRAYWRLGRVAEAKTHLERAVELKRRHFPDDPRSLAKSLVDIGWVMWARGEIAAAEEVLREACAIYSADEWKPPDALEALRILQLVALAQGEEEESDRLVKRARKIVASLPGKSNAHLAAMLQSQSDNWRQQGRIHEAVELGQESVEMLRNTVHPTHPEMAFGLMILGKALTAAKRYGEAESCLKDALGTFRKYYPQESKRCTHDAFFALINALRVQNKNEEVATLLDDRVDRLQNQRPSSTLPDAYAYLSVTEEKKGEYERAINYRSKAIAIWGQLAESEPQNEWFRREQAFFSMTLARLLYQLECFDQALERCEVAVRLHTELSNDFPDNPEYKARLSGSQSVQAKILKKLEEDNASHQTTELFDG